MDGICYLFCGVGFAERIVTSLHTLRKHWTGPVTVFVTDDDCERVMRGAGSLNINVERRESFPINRHKSYVTKTLIPTWTPYDRTLFLDGDTTIHGDLTPLFGPALGITQFADWVSTGRRMSKRINEWRGLTPAIDALVEKQLASPHSAINTGVFTFTKGFSPLAQWHEITVAGQKKFIGDEIAMQLLFSEIPECVVFDDHWNCSPVHGVHRDTAVVWHYHGEKHLREKDTHHSWIPHFQEAFLANAGGMADWPQRYDRGAGSFVPVQQTIAATPEKCCP